MGLDPLGKQRASQERQLPSSKEDLAPTAEKNGVCGELVERLQDPGDEEFSGPDDVMATLKSL